MYGNNNKKMTNDISDIKQGQEEIIRELKMKKRPRPNQYFFQAYLDTFPDILIDLPKSSLKVLGHMLKHMQRQNVVNMSQKQIAEHLNMQQPAVCRAMKPLFDNCILYRHMGVLYLHPKFGWRGHEKHKREQVSLHFKYGQPA